MNVQQPERATTRSAGADCGTLPRRMTTAARRANPMVLALLVLALANGCGKTEREAAYDGYVRLRTDSVSARFAAGSQPTCRERLEGTCSFRDCDAVPPPALVSAGSIAVRGMADFGSCQLSPQDELGEYAPCSSVEPLWDPSQGGELEVAASGDVIPAFSRVVIAPRAVTLTEPADAQQLVDAGDEVSKALPRSNDLRVRWTGGGPGVVVVSTAGGWPEIRCEAPADAEEIDVPRELLQLLDARLRIVSVHHETRDVVHVAGATVSLDANIPLGSYSLGYAD